MKLGLKDTQQRELVHVTLHCCLQVSSDTIQLILIFLLNRKNIIIHTMLFWDRSCVNIIEAIRLAQYNTTVVQYTRILHYR